MTRIKDYSSHVRVKTAELKSRLSHYLRLVRKSGESVEVCVREEPVAMLAPIRPPGRTEAEARALDDLRQRLEAAGLGLVAEEIRAVPLPTVTASPAGDGRADLRTVAAVRSEREW